MFPLTYIKVYLVYLLNNPDSFDYQIVQGFYQLIKSENIDGSNQLSNLAIIITKEIIENNSNIFKAVSSTVSYDFMLEELITSLKNETIDESEIYILKNIIFESLSLMNIQNNVEKIQDLSTKIINRELKTVSDIREKYSLILNNVIDTLIKLNSIENSESLVIDSDNLEDVAERFVSYYSKNRVVLPTDITKLDEYLRGGLHSSRLYTFVLKSGDGKSTLMLALMKQLQKTLKKGTPVYNRIKEHLSKLDIPNCKPTIYFYTLENSIDETLERYLPSFMPMNEKDIFTNKEKVYIHLSEEFREIDVSIKLKYRGSFTTSPIDIMQDIEQEKVKGFYPIAIFIDYLGVMVSSTKQEKRLQLEEITAGLKNLAVLYNVPVITGAQVKKDSFDKDELHLSDIKESSGIIDNSDVIITSWQTAPLNLGQVLFDMKIEKQRNYIKNVKFSVGIDFNKFEFINVSDNHQNKMPLPNNTMNEPKSSFLNQKNSSIINSLL